MTLTDTETIALFGDDLEPLLEGQRLRTLAEITNWEQRQADERAERLANCPPMVIGNRDAPLTGRWHGPVNPNWASAKSYCPDYERLEPAGAGLVVQGYMKIWPKHHNMGLPMASLNITPGDGFTYEPTDFQLTGNYAVHTWPSGDRCIVSLEDGERSSFYDAVQSGIAKKLETQPGIRS